MKKFLFPILIGMAIMILVMVVRWNSLQHHLYSGFDTWIEVDIPARFESLSPDLHQMVQEYDVLWDRFSPESMVWIINHSSQPVPIDEVSYDLIEKAVVLSGKTEGFFNCLVAPLMDLWGFSDRPAVPPPRLLHDMVEQVSRTRIDMNPLGHEVMIRGEGKIDLGGIAKGYLVDRMVLFLKSKGVSHALVNAGGTVYGWGRPFRVGIMHPRSTGLIGTVEIQDLAVSTSGDYFRFFEKEGFRYYHILNPYTGYPGRDFASVTIIDSNATEADVLSTAVMVGGKVFIPEVERRFPRVAIIGITAAGNITLNERARQIFHPLSSERLKK